jgi:hypothetical protein
MSRTDQVTRQLPGASCQHIAEETPSVQVGVVNQIFQKPLSQLLTGQCTNAVCGVGSVDESGPVTDADTSEGSPVH